MPIANVWDNVIYTCGTILAFRSEQQVDDWCEKHSISKGVILSINHTWELAKIWYGKHLDIDWKKWTTREAQEIFIKLGLTSDFWKIPDTDERF